MTVSKRDLSGTLVVDGQPFCWELRREPQWCTRDGWQGMRIAIWHRDGQREALMEFPMPPRRRSRREPDLQRPQVNPALLGNAVRTALGGGWEPLSRGKPMAFAVDANGCLRR